jgi:cell wall-associated NlpC family hydrolase
VREAYIKRRARAFGLDPAAVLAVARSEGLSGGIGDGGHAFGPFQLNNAGGVLTNHPAGHQNNQGAWSNAGIDYALKGIARVAQGLHGHAAINAIVRRFERPADPDGEVRRAIGYYGQGGGGSGGMARRAMGTPGGGTDRDALLQAVMAQNQAFATGNDSGDLWSYYQAAQEAMQTGGSIAPPRSKSGGLPRSSGGPVANRILSAAHKQIGQPYVWGGESRKEGGFDCSGLIQWAYAQQGIQIPRTTYEQIKKGKKVGWGKFHPGDLIFSNGGKHVVMYVGNGKVIAAPHTGAVVRYQSVNDFKSSFAGARRYL